MNSTASKVAVIGSGVSGAVCAATLAKNGVQVTIFESARGPGGRMSQRREYTDDGKELLFDHGAPYFTVTEPEVLQLVREWESRGLVAIWKESFGAFDYHSCKFVDMEKEEPRERYVGVPGMNSICRALCSEKGVDIKFGTTVEMLEWSEAKNLWTVMGLGGQNFGQFKGIVASDKNIVSPRTKGVTGRPPLDLSMIPELAVKLQDLPVKPCFSLMLAFADPLLSIPVKGFSIKNSKVLSAAHCNSSKPGRETSSETWVLYSTAGYAENIIAQTGLQKLSDVTLKKVADELFNEFQSSGLDISRPYFMKAHRWGSAFPATSVAEEEKCLWDREKKVAICGDFCTAANVEGAIQSSLAAASKLVEIISSL